MIDLRLIDLHYFLMLSRNKSFTVTAEEFFVSQPAISQSLKKLENELNTTLLIRDRKKNTLHLTQTGEFLRDKTEQLFKILDEITSEIGQVDNEEVHLGIPPIIGGYLLPQYLPHLMSISDNIQIIEGDGSIQLLKMLKGSELTTAIIGFSEKDPEELSNYDVHLLYEDNYGLYISKKHPLAEKEKVSYSDLNGETFISFGHGFVQKGVQQQWLKRNRIKPRTVIYTNEVQTAKAYIEANSVMLMMDLAIHESNPIKRLDLDDQPKFYIYLIESKDLSPSSHQVEVNKIIKQIATKFKHNKLN